MISSPFKTKVTLLTPIGHIKMLIFITQSTPFTTDYVCPVFFSHSKHFHQRKVVSLRQMKEPYIPTLESHNT